MQVQLYKHVEGLRFDEPSTIILRDDVTFHDHDTFYNNYIAPALYWTGDGKTYNIENIEICEVPLDALSTATEDVEPVYLKIIEPTAHGTRFKYYYITNIEYLALKARLYLSLDVFSTYYGRAKLKANSLIIKRSTLKIDPSRLILLPDEVTPESNYIPQGIPPKPQSNLTQAVIAPIGDLVFIIKLKLLTAKSISDEAYTTRVLTIPVGTPADGTDWYTHIVSLYLKIINIYEAESNFAGIGLKCELQDIALTPAEFWVTQSIAINLRYVNPQTATGETIAAYAVNFVNNSALTFKLNTPTTQHNKIIIGNNQIELPAYSKPDIIKILPVYNVSDFDILFKYQNNEPQSIKTYFQCEVSNSTNETSLEKIARLAGYIMGFQSAASSAAVSAGTSMATGNPLGFVAAGMSIKGATDNITAGIIQKATRQALPATRFTSNAFTVFLDRRTLQSGYIYQEYAPLTNPELSQAITSLKYYGVEWYNEIEALEDLIYYKLIIKDFAQDLQGRRYIEAQAIFEGLPLNYAQDIVNLLESGVEIVGA